MTVIVGVIGAALLFAVFTVVRPSDNRGCTGHCAGCTGDSACESDGVKGVKP